VSLRVWVVVTPLLLGGCGDRHEEPQGKALEKQAERSVPGESAVTLMSNIDMEIMRGAARELTQADIDSAITIGPGAHLIVGRSQYKKAIEVLNGNPAYREYLKSAQPADSETPIDGGR
jgi:hypothetical protein